MRSKNVEEENVKQIKIKALDNEDYEFKKAITVKIKTEENSLLAVYDKLNFFGLGDTEDEAVEDLLTEIVEMYEDFEKNPPAAGSASAQWWDHLKSILRRKAKA